MVNSLALADHRMCNIEKIFSFNVELWIQPFFVEKTPDFAVLESSEVRNHPNEPSKAYLSIPRRFSDQNLGHTGRV